MRQPPLTSRLSGFGTSVFAEMTALAKQHDAVNLGQGYPDFDGPDFVKRAAAGAQPSSASPARGRERARTVGADVATRGRDPAHASAAIRVTPLTSAGARLRWPTPCSLPAQGRASLDRDARWSPAPRGVARRSCLALP